MLIPFVLRCPRSSSMRSQAARRSSGALVAAGALFLALPRDAHAEASVHYKYQDYREESDRIRVVSHYGIAEVDLGTATRLRARGVLDTITGATPTGQPAPAGSTQVVLSNLEDERRAAVVDVTRTFGESSVRLEYAHSDEDDYLSRGISGTLVHELNEKNTQMQLGFSYIDDDIEPAFFSTARRKISRDVIFGVTQLLGPNTTLTANVSAGISRGFLSDPYKIVQKTVEVAPGLTLPLTFPENRPDSRFKTIGFLQVMHFVEKARGSVDASLRLYSDNHGITSGTLEAAWFQRFGERFVLRPAVRYYQQSEADYYFPNLDATVLEPVVAPNQGTPRYSSDYRLSKFGATTLGLKAIYTVTDRWSLDAMYERYVMKGRDDATPDSAYASANIFTVGLKVWF